MTMDELFKQLNDHMQVHGQPLLDTAFKNAMERLSLDAGNPDILADQAVMLFKEDITSDTLLIKPTDPRTVDEVTQWVMTALIALQAGLAAYLMLMNQETPS